MLASRIPEKKAFTGRSRCPNCDHVLEPSELIPLLSYLLQKGRCKHCGVRISGGYVLVELSTASSFVLFHRHFGHGVVGVLHIIIAFHFALLAGTDLMHGLLPNTVILSGSVVALALRVVAPLAGTGALASLFTDEPSLVRAAVLPPLRFSGVSVTTGSLAAVWVSLRDGLFAAFLAFAFFYIVALVKPGAMGGGDIKMALFIGLYLGVRKVFPALGLGFILSSLYAVPMMVMGKLKRTDTLPLGIYLSLATVIMAVFRL